MDGPYQAEALKASVRQARLGKLPEAAYDQWNKTLVERRRALDFPTQ
jgi:hypothetical protein